MRGTIKLSEPGTLLTMLPWTLVAPLLAWQKDCKSTFEAFPGKVSRGVEATEDGRLQHLPNLGGMQAKALADGFLSCGVQGAQVWVALGFRKLAKQLRLYYADRLYATSPVYNCSNRTEPYILPLEPCWPQKRLSTLNPKPPSPNPKNLQPKPKRPKPYPSP